MSDEKKDPTFEKHKFTKEGVARQIEQTTRELQYFQEAAQRSVGLLQYLKMVQEKYDLPDEPKKETPLEVK